MAAAGLALERASQGALARFLFDPLPIYPLLVARVAWGLALFSAYLVRLPYLSDLYGPAGLPGARWLSPSLHHSVYLEGVYALVERALPALDMAFIWVAYALVLAGSLGFALGLRTRLAGSVALLAHLFFAEVRNPLAYWGWASLLNGLWLYVLCAPVGRFFSLDDWLARRRSGAPPRAAEHWLTPAWPLRLVQLGACLMYYAAGFARLDDPGWQRGQMVYAALAHQLYGRWPLDLEPLRPALAAFNYLTYALEPLAAFGLWLRWGWIAAYLLIAMHLALELLTNVEWWNVVMIPALLCFAPRSHLEALFRRLPGGPG